MAKRKPAKRRSKRVVPDAPVAAQLAPIRKAIDSLDTQIVDLLNRRAQLAVDIGAIKRSLKQRMYAPERERQLIERLLRGNRGPLPGESLRLVYKEIISASLALERPLEVAYLGPEATFTHEATKRHFGSSARLAPLGSIPEVFDEVERGRSEYGVVPIENSTEGVVNHTLDMFMTGELSICAEVLIEVRHNLLTKGGSLAGVRRVVSHPQALAQCRAWLQSSLPNVEQVDVASTARAAQLAAADPEVGAIASDMAAGLYDVQIAAEHIEDFRGNVTRFLVIGNDQTEPTGSDRTSIMFALKDSAGVLYKALRPLAASGLNLSRIESRPSRRRAWDYQFFIDLEGHIAEKRVATAIDRLRTACVFTKVLGSYPRARLSKRRKSVRGSTQ